MDNRSPEKTAMGLTESSKAHEKNIGEAIGSASQDMQKRINKSEKQGKIPENGVVMTYSETVVFSGPELLVAKMKKRWIAQYSSKLPGEHAYNLRKHSRTVMVTPMPDNSQLWQTWDVADIHPNAEAKKRLEANAKGDTDEGQKTDGGSEG